MIPKTFRRPSGRSLLIGVVSTSWLVALVAGALPAWRQAHRQHREVAQVEAQLGELDRWSVAGLWLERSLPPREAAVQPVWNRLFPADRRCEELFLDLARVADESGVTQFELHELRADEMTASPTEVVDEEPAASLTAYRVRAQFEGDFAGVAGFLGGLGRLDRAVAVHDLEITPAKGAVHVDLELDVYVATTAQSSSPPAVVGVLAVLAILIVVNVRTFAPRGAHRARAAAAAEVRVQAHPSLPLDIADVMRNSGGPPAELGRSVNGPRPDVARDPFTAAAVTAGVGVPSTAPRAAPVVRGGAPICTAVMLGAGAPMALVDGRLCRVGDRVKQYVIERIDARGVSLGGDRKLFLPVGVTSSGEGTNMVVTGEASGDRQGRTSLVEYADSERK